MGGSYRVKRVTVKSLFGNLEESDVIGIVVPILGLDNTNKKEYLVCTDNGDLMDTMNYRIVDINIVKNIPEETRKILDSIGKHYKKQNNDIVKMRREIRIMKSNLKEQKDQADRMISNLKNIYKL